jgi:hypothetical protein
MVAWCKSANFTKEKRLQSERATGANSRKE